MFKAKPYHFLVLILGGGTPRERTINMSHNHAVEKFPAALSVPPTLQGASKTGTFFGFVVHSKVRVIQHPYCLMLQNENILWFN